MTVTTNSEELSVAELVNVSKTFRRGDEIITALRHVDLTVRRGEVVCVRGPSGAGKSTLLHLVGALEEPDEGVVKIEGRAIASLRDVERTELRRRRIGFVFQFFHLLSNLAAWENVAMPLLLDRVGVRDARRRAEAVLEGVGLGHRMSHRPHELSGGQLQRVAIARALVGSPALLLADEPTGNLDSSIDLLVAIVHDAGTPLVLVTHDDSVAAAADRTFLLRDGALTPLPDVSVAGLGP